MDDETTQPITPPPNREEDPTAWMEWRTKIWAEGFEMCANNLLSLAARMRDNTLTYADDYTICAILDGALNGLTAAKAFYAREGWITAVGAARSLIDDFGPSNTKMPEEIEQYLRQFGGSGG